jgi:dTDP-4-dehydrorhamnose 3,5-epimerase
MKIKKTRIKGVVEIIRTPIRDSRGLFSRMFCDDNLQRYLHLKKIKQINHSISCVFGSIRGMHLQLKEHAETKIISCIVGKIYDVAIQEIIFVSACSLSCKCIPLIDPKTQEIL